MVRFAAAVIAIAASFIGISANAQPIVLLDFWSPHCGPCMQMKPIMHSLEEARYPIHEIDTTRDSQMSQKYNVTQIPCFVMLVNGQETERQLGGTSSESLQQMFERAKDQLRRVNGTHNQSPDDVPQMRNAAPAQGEAIGPAPQPGAQAWPPGNTATADRQPNASNLAVGTAPTAADAKLIAATVRLTIDDPQGRSCGTGTIVDTRSGEALVFTCGHLFRETKGKAPVKADLFELAGDGVHVVGHATGQVISYDLTRDVALISIRPDHAVGVAPVASLQAKVEPGDRVVGIGCSNGNDPTVLYSRITSLDRYHGPPNIEATGAPAIGRSGGGLFNARGELVGVCNNADAEGNEGIYAGLQCLHEELDRLNLKAIYAKTEAPKTSGDDIVPRGQELPITPIPNDPAAAILSGAANAAPTKQAAPHNFSETEQAALVEIMSRASTSEVVCIIRPKESGGQSEVIQLDSVSPEFVQALKNHSVQPTKTR